MNTKPTQHRTLDPAGDDHVVPFQVAGPPLAGFIFDTRGSYDVALWVFFVANALSVPMLALLGRVAPSDAREPGSLPPTDPEAEAAV